MGEENLHGNLSQQELVRHAVNMDGEEADGNGGRETPPEVENASSRLTKSKMIDVSILCFINLINYMDRFTVAGK